MRRLVNALDAVETDTGPELSDAEREAIYAGMERARVCNQFVDRASGCAWGEPACLCFNIGGRIIEALRETRAREECARRGIDPDELCADGGVEAWMVVAQEMKR